MAIDVCKKAFRLAGSDWITVALLISYPLAITKDTLQLLLNKSFDCFFVRFDDHHSIDAWLLVAHRIFVRSYGCVAGHSVVVQQRSISTVTGGRWRQSYNLCAEKNDSQELHIYIALVFFYCFSATRQMLVVLYTHFGQCSIKKTMPNSAEATAAILPAAVHKTKVTNNNRTLCM